MELDEYLMIDISKTNVLLITLDSLNAEIAKCAKTPNLNRIGKLRLAETHSSYTLPAHIALLTQGNLPTPIDGGRKYLGLDRVWRSSSSRGRTLNIGITFNSTSLPEYYHDKGYIVKGIGGVGFFDPSNKTNILPNMIQNYSFPDRISGKGWASEIPLDKVSSRFRIGQSCPMTTRLSEVCELVNEENPWFLFCNIAETHFPYTVPGDQSMEEFLDFLTDAWKFYPDKSPGSCKLNKKVLKNLKDLQLNTLEQLDLKIGKVLNSVSSSRPTLVVICSDHGEEFGEFGRLGHGHASQAVWQVPIWIGLIH